MMQQATIKLEMPHATHASTTYDLTMEPELEPEPEPELEPPTPTPRAAVPTIKTEPLITVTAIISQSPPVSIDLTLELEDAVARLDLERPAEEEEALQEKLESLELRSVRAAPPLENDEAPPVDNAATRALERREPEAAAARCEAIDAVDQETADAMEQLRALELMMSQQRAQDTLHEPASAPDPEPADEADAATQAAMAQIHALEAQLQRQEAAAGCPAVEAEREHQMSTGMEMVPAVVEMRAAADDNASSPEENAQVYAQLAELEAQMAELAAKRQAMLAQLSPHERALATSRIHDITGSERASDGMMEDLVRLSTQIHFSSRALVNQVHHRMACPSPEISPPASPEMSSDSDSDSDGGSISYATPPRKAAEVWDSEAQTWTVLPSMPAGRTAGSKARTRRGKRGGRGGVVGKAQEARKKLLWVNGSAPVIGRNKATHRPPGFV